MTGCNSETVQLTIGERTAYCPNCQTVYDENWVQTVKECAPYLYLRMMQRPRAQDGHQAASPEK